MTTTVLDRARDLTARWAEHKQANPGVWVRDAAEALGSSEV